MRKKLALLTVGSLVLGAFALVGCKVAWVGPVEQACSATDPGKVDVIFHWTPATEGDGVQYLDLSVYSTFPPGLFLGVGPMPSNQNALTWPGLSPNTVHHWRVNTLIDGVWYTSWTGTFTTAACGTGSGAAPTAGMRMVIPRIGVNAPVNVRVLGADGNMGNPNGKDDVIWYDFSAFGGMGGFPGNSATRTRCSRVTSTTTPTSRRCSGTCASWCPAMRSTSICWMARCSDTSCSGLSG